MNSIVLVIVAALVLILAYRFYGAFISAKVLVLDETRSVPSKTHEDSREYIPTNKWLLFGHHFAAIAGAGPLIGPVLAAQFGYLPGTLWLLIGGVLAGGVHDVVILFASVRHEGKSIAEIAKDNIGTRMGILTSIAVLAILVIGVAGLAITVVNALYNSPWSTFSVGITIPIAIFVGVYLKFLRPNKIGEATVIGMVLVILGVILGPYIPNTPLAPYLTFTVKQMSVILPLYGFLAAALPVWLLLLPRDYLSTYMKIGVILALALGILLVRPAIQMPAVTSFVDGGGPIIPGKLFPFLFITIACGALSGMHALVSSGITPKLIANEKDILPIGFGGMLVETFIALMALIAATCLPTADYFAINSSPEVFATLHMNPVDLPMLSNIVGENLAGRAGGSVSLAVGMAYIFHKIPGFKDLLSYWYHFCIMFEALFILTALDSSTRIARYLLQELCGKFYKPFDDKSSWFNMIFFSAVVSIAWGYMLYTGNISTIWPLFGTANQLLAAIALAIGTTIILKKSKPIYALTTGIPLVFITVITITAVIENVFGNYIPKGKLMLAIISCVLLLLTVLILIECITVWIKDLNKIRKLQNEMDI